MRRLIALGLLIPAIAGAQPGVTFTYEMRTSAGQSTTAKDMPPYTAMTVQAAGPNMRIEWREGASAVPMMKPGAYMILRGNDKTLTIVSPEDKTAIKMEAGSLGTGAGRMTNNAMVKVSQRDGKFDFEDLGAGDKILGYATRHIRVSSSGTTEIRVLGKKSTTTNVSTGDVWIAPKLNGIDADALRAWGTAFGRGLRATNAELLPRQTDYERQFGDGIALRTVNVINGSDEKGRARVDTVKMEVTDIKSGRLDPKLFTVPDGYQVQDMREVAKAMDSAYKASGMDTVNMKGVAKEAGKEGAKDAVKGALGGFLRKKKP